MEIFYTITTPLGLAKYGEKFDNYEHVVAYHDAKVREGLTLHTISPPTTR